MSNFVIIESPFNGDVESNIEYAEKCLKDSIERGEIPFASHLLYTRVLDDSKKDERDKGINLGFKWHKKADALVVYKDFGITKGMKRGIKNAKKEGLIIIYRSIIGRKPTKRWKW